MKSLINLTSLKGIVLFVLCATTFTAFGQLPQINAKFENPSFDRVTRVYSLDVQLNSSEAPEILFGMNLRFFYDATLMTFMGADQFQPGYGVLGDAPTVTVGNEQGGIQLFGLPGAAAYVNGGVQLLDESRPLTIPANGWVKAFRVKFKVPVTALSKPSFCPSVIWDLEANADNGGFLPGSAGLLITVAERDRATRYESAPSIPSGLSINWVYSTQGGLPYGKAVKASCIPVSTIGPTEAPGKTKIDGFSLFQNQPNPFGSRTVVEFTLPEAQNATLILFDVEGVVQETIEGSYMKGKNQIELKKKSWMNESSLIYYRLQTDKYTSQTLTMSLIRA